MVYSAYIMDDYDKPIGVTEPVYTVTNSGYIALMLLGVVVIVAALGYAAWRGIDKLRVW